MHESNETKLWDSISAHTDRLLQNQRSLFTFVLNFVNRKWHLLLQAETVENSEANNEKRDREI